MTAPTTSLVEIVTTVASEADARTLARGLVEARIAVCVSFFPVQSVYRWEGEICEEAEVQIVVKTDVRRAGAVEVWIRERHPYETPAILRVPVLGANRDYERWALEGLEESS